MPGIKLILSLLLWLTFFGIDYVDAEKNSLTWNFTNLPPAVVKATVDGEPYRCGGVQEAGMLRDVTIKCVAYWNGPSKDPTFLQRWQKGKGPVLRQGKDLPYVFIFPSYAFVEGASCLVHLDLDACDDPVSPVFVRLPTRPS